MVATGYQQITSLGAATALTIPTNTRAALIQAESQNVRWRGDGTDPTASVGMILVVGQPVWFDFQKLSRLRFIETTASAKLNISYFGPDA